MLSLISKFIYTIFILGLVYEILEYQRVYNKIWHEKTSDISLVLEDVCVDAIKKSRYHDRVDCRGAEISAYEGIVSSAFRSWWESRYIYKLITLNDIYTKVGVFMIVIFFIKQIFHHKVQVAAIEHRRITGSDVGSGSIKPNFYYPSFLLPSSSSRFPMSHKRQKKQQTRRYLEYTRNNGTGTDDDDE